MNRNIGIAVILLGMAAALYFFLQSGDGSLQPAPTDRKNSDASVNGNVGGNPPALARTPAPADEGDEGDATARPDPEDVKDDTVHPPESMEFVDILDNQMRREYMMAVAPCNTDGLAENTKIRIKYDIIIKDGWATTENVSGTSDSPVPQDTIDCMVKAVDDMRMGQPNMADWVQPQYELFVRVRSLKKYRGWIKDQETGEW